MKLSVGAAHEDASTRLEGLRVEDTGVQISMYRTRSRWGKRVASELGLSATAIGVVLERLSMQHHRRD
jgi:hypothetical protein